MQPAQFPAVKTVWAVVLLAAFVAALNYLAWSLMGVSPPAPDVTSRVNGVTYAPYARSDAPWIRHEPAAQTISADLQQLSAITRHIRTYSAGQFPELPELAARHGIDLTLGAWLDKDWGSNDREIKALLNQASVHSNIKRLIVGNETILKQSLTVQQLSEHLQRVRSQTRLPVSTAEPWHVWIKHPELADQVDFITIHLLPYWEGVGLDTAVEESFERMARVRARFPGKEIVIGEIGYPSSGDSIKRAHPSPAAQAAFVRQFVQKASLEKLNYFLIEAYDQPWKQTEEGRAGAYWGLYDAARQPKFAFSGPVVPDAYWRVKALGSSALGFVFLLYFLTRFANLSRLARTTFALAAQATVSLATVIVTLPLLHYMRAGDWLMLAILIPTSIMMVAILLAHFFEFVELFWVGSLRRSFQPIPLPNDAKQPFVSIHLACCNEPPAMVIATIESLRSLQYRNFEVIVIDNNTNDPTLWQPVRDHMACMPSNFRFVHLPQWPGYKAGALNYALEQTDLRAEVVAVVDADYVVRPEWLIALVGYFSDPKVGIVQAPQAHRDWGGTVFRKMMNWEYDGFFRIGMHHRNERDAIIQHGTMTMIRAQSLKEHGRWSEWCLCEDAELGLRLMQQDLRTVYVDQVMGEGLTPDSFSAFKKQRQRWAQGGMQILKAHWCTLLGLHGAKPLSLGQRYHFLAGWLPWIGDLFHFFFVLSALAWTIGVLAFPQYFSLPIPLFMLPLAVFCAAKLVMGPLLYWRRVPCSAKGILGAAIAGMGLSHAIARGVLAGLFHHSGVFQITAKGTNTNTASNAPLAFAKPALKPMYGQQFSKILKPAREEALLLLALMLAILAIAITRNSNHIESALWMLMLALQALPYSASVICAIAAGLHEQTVATPGQPTHWFSRLFNRVTP